MKNKVLPFVFLFKTLFTNHITTTNRCNNISMNNINVAKLNRELVHMRIALTDANAKLNIDTIVPRVSIIQPENNNVGWIYCLSNKGMPGIYKIGKTKISPEERAKQLYTTGVPYPFKIEMAKYVTEYHKKEKSFQKILNQYSCNHSREFFQIDIAIIIELFNIIEEYKITKKKK